MPYVEWFCNIDRRVIYTNSFAIADIIRAIIIAFANNLFKQVEGKTFTIDFEIEITIDSRAITYIFVCFKSAC